MKDQEGNKYSNPSMAEGGRASNIPLSSGMEAVCLSDLKLGST